MKDYKYANRVIRWEKLLAFEFWTPKSNTCWWIKLNTYRFLFLLQLDEELKETELAVSANENIKRGGKRKLEIEEDEGLLGEEEEEEEEEELGVAGIKKRRLD